MQIEKDRSIHIGAVLDYEEFSRCNFVASWISFSFPISPDYFRNTTNPVRFP